MNPIFKTLITEKIKDPMGDWVEIDPINIGKLICMNHDETINHSWVYDGHNIVWLPEGSVDDVIDWLNMHKLFYSLNSFIKLNTNIVIDRDPYHIIGKIFDKCNVYNISDDLIKSTAILNGIDESVKNNNIDTYISLDDNINVLSETDQYENVILVFKNVDSYLLSAIQFFLYLTESEEFFNIEKIVTLREYSLCYFKKRNKSEFKYYD